MRDPLPQPLTLDGALVTVRNGPLLLASLGFTGVIVMWSGPLGAVPEADRGLAHELAAGTLRYRSALDAAIAPHLDRGPDRIREDLLDILRLGAYQILFLDRIPAHAAVDTAVALGRRIAGARVGGFVNAVLRRISEERVAKREEVSKAEIPSSLLATRSSGFYF